MTKEKVVPMLGSWKIYQDKQLMLRLGTEPLSVTPHTLFIHLNLGTSSTDNLMVPIKKANH